MLLGVFSSVETKNRPLSVQYLHWGIPRDHELAAHNREETCNNHPLPGGFSNSVAPRSVQQAPRIPKGLLHTCHSSRTKHQGIKE